MASQRERKQGGGEDKPYTLKQAGTGAQTMVVVHVVRSTCHAMSGRGSEDLSHKPEPLPLVGKRAFAQIMAP